MWKPHFDGVAWLRLAAGKVTCPFHSDQLVRRALRRWCGLLRHVVLTAWYFVRLHYLKVRLIEQEYIDRFVIYCSKGFLNINLVLARKLWVYATKTVMDMHWGNLLVTRSAEARVRPLMPLPPVLLSCMRSHWEQNDTLSSRRVSVYTWCPRLETRIEEGRAGGSFAADSTWTTHMSTIEILSHESWSAMCIISPFPTRKAEN